MCIKILCHSNVTYLQYYVQGGNLGRHNELVLFLQIRICFRYVPENYIEEEILG